MSGTRRRNRAQNESSQRGSLLSFFRLRTPRRGVVSPIDRFNPVPEPRYFSERMASLTHWACHRRTAASPAASPHCLTYSLGFKSLYIERLKFIIQRVRPAASGMIAAKLNYGALANQVGGTSEHFGSAESPVLERAAAEMDYPFD